MAREDQYLRMRLLDKTPGAIKVTGYARLPENGQAISYEWLPRSLIGYSRTEPQGDGELPVIVFTLPEWKIDQADLWNFTTDAR